MPGTGSIRLYGGPAAVDREVKLTNEVGDTGVESHHVTAGSPMSVDDVGLAWVYGVQINGALCDGRFEVSSDLHVEVEVTSDGSRCRVEQISVGPIPPAQPDES